MNAEACSVPLNDGGGRWPAPPSQPAQQRWLLALAFSVGAASISRRVARISHSVRLALAERRGRQGGVTLGAEVEAARGEFMARQLHSDLHVFLADPAQYAGLRLPGGLLRGLIEDCMPGGVGATQLPLWIWLNIRATNAPGRRAAAILEITCRTFGRPAEFAASRAVSLRCLTRRLAHHFGGRSQIQARAHSDNCTVVSITLPAVAVNLR